MKRSTPLLWISFGLVSLTLSILLVSDLAVDLIPNQSIERFKYRQQYSEALAVQYSLLAEHGDSRAIQEAFDLLVERNEDLVSAAVILANGEMLAFAGQHQVLWNQPPGDSSTSDHIQVPIFNGADRWGTVQLRFRSTNAQGWFDWLNDPWVRFLALAAGSGFLGYFLYMKRTLHQLDPSSVVPLRVKAAFDVLTESVVLLNTGERIVLANRAFCDVVGKPSNELMGKRLDEFHWSFVHPATRLTPFPWVTARKEKCLELDFPLMLPNSSGKLLKFHVNCTPILNEQEDVQGLLVSFNDVTILEEAIRSLEASKAEMESLAMRDPLTGIFNRRALFEAFEDLYSASSSEETDFGCIMADIDHFKSFNDRYGHAVGDQVIQVVANILSSTIRPTDIMGRYGGEEFCILLPGQGPKGTAIAAERLRLAIAARASQSVRTTGDTRITMSFGVSCLSLGASDPLELVDQADKGLYAAKQAGRNQVGQWTREGPMAGLAIELELLESFKV
ncbi:MAG: sensor domain-containing diguanylate cyclase [Nitrospirota bacterium]|nr:sensor domain-containing diguanylate cyclase [Nitrospirota bacterium]